MTNRVQMPLWVVVAAVLSHPLLSASGFELEQVGCFAPGALHADVLLSGDGRTLVFSASADLVPGENPLGIPQLFALDLESRTTRQITPALMGTQRDAELCRATRATVSSDGQRMIAVATCGVAPEETRWRLFEYRGGETRALGRWTRCAPTVRPQALAADGRRLAITAACDPLHARVAKRPPRNWLWLQRRPGAPLRRSGPPGCEMLAPALDTADGPLAFLSTCDPRGENRSGAMNLFVQERRGSRPRQLTHAVYGGAGGKCGALQFTDAVRTGLFEPPTLAPAGPLLFAAPCLDERDVGSALVHRLWRFSRETWRPEEIPLPACNIPEADALRVVTSPVAASRGAERIALVRSCARVGDVREGEQALVVLREGAPPLTLLANQGYQVLVHREIRRPALDEAGTLLATISAEPPPGCAGAETPQLVIARDLDDPVLRRVTCGCGPA